MEARDYFASRRVFTAEEFGQVLGLGRRSRDSLLSYYRQRGRILPVRRGLYWVVPAGEGPETCAIDPFLVAGLMTDDAVLAYHTALEFHGRAYSTFTELYYLSARAARPTGFRGWQFQPVRVPKALLATGKVGFDVETLEQSGQNVRVTSLECTMVDVLDRPELSGGWEETWRSLEMVEFFDLDRVVDYALFLGNATTVAKVGWFLDCHRESLMVEDQHLTPLREHRPRQPRYLSRRHPGPVRMIGEWNLIVPEALAEQRWAEVT